MQYPIKLTVDQIAEPDSENLADNAWNVSLCLVDEKSDEAEELRKLTPAWRAVKVTYHLFVEVQNGGLHQFFWNTEGTLNDFVREGLQLFGASPYLKIFVDACAIFDAHDYEAEKRDSGNTWEGFTSAYREKRLEELDTAFYNQYNVKSLPEFIADYIRANPNEFT
jgi:hypothetical protein